MILLDKPFASQFLLDTIAEHCLPTVATPNALELGLQPGAHVLDEATAIETVRAAQRAGQLKLYTNSENALAWVVENLAFAGLNEAISNFKDKARFRRLTEPLFPNYYCRELKAAELDQLDPGELPFPLVLKPSVGFFSAGVRRIGSLAEWPSALESLRHELAGFESVYPKQVLDSETFVLEQYIEGREFAIDAYYDADGEPIILNLLEHKFSSHDDVGDRVYTTSAALIREHLERFTRFLSDLGRLNRAHDIPVHVELRITADNALFPIEVNPVRFGGWCTTADLTWHAFGFNSYRYYLDGQRPDWDEILADKADRLFSLIVLNNSTGRDVEQIEAFDYDRLAKKFSNLREMRRIDHQRFRLFGFVFLETAPDDEAELDWILQSDLVEFVSP